MEKSFRLGFLALNNEVEYEALLVGLRMSRQVRVDRVRLHCDSWLVVSQISSEFEVKDHRMMSYLEKVRVLKHQFKEMEILQIFRGSNSRADTLATLASSVADPLKRIVSVELLPFSSVIPSNKDLILSIHLFVSWMDPIIDYPQNGTFPENKRRGQTH